MKEAMITLFLKTLLQSQDRAMLQKKELVKEVEDRTQ